MPDKPQPSSELKPSSELALTLEDLQAQLAAANVAADAAREEAARANGERMMARATLEAIQATQDLLDAKRALTLAEDPDETETESRMAQEVRDVKSALDAQPKFTILLPEREQDEGKAVFEYLQCMGYGFHVQRGVPVDVPESIYQQAISSHLNVRPQRREDISLVPVREKPGIFGQKLQSVQ